MANVIVVKEISDVVDREYMLKKVRGFDYEIEVYDRNETRGYLITETALSTPEDGFLLGVLLTNNSGLIQFVIMDKELIRDV